MIPVSSPLSGQEPSPPMSWARPSGDLRAIVAEGHAVVQEVQAGGRGGGKGLEGAFPLKRLAEEQTARRRPVPRPMAYVATPLRTGGPMPARSP